jgi:hypothetical protein
MELVSESIGSRNYGVLVCADIQPFKSIVDGTIITGRRALREHNLRNNVTFTEDYRQEWKDKAKIRDKMYSGDRNFDRQRRIEHIKNAVEKHTRRR